MLTVVSASEMRKWIEEFLAERPDIGLRMAFTNIVLESRNPFDPRAPRKPKAAFVLGAGLLAAGLLCFSLFNFGR
jgi:hypothetical protein